MSLLDFFTKGTGDPDKDAAITQGLLNAGLALMQSKGKLFPALGQAGMVGLQAGQQTQQQQMQARRAALQDKMLRGQVDQQERQAAIDALPGQFYRAPSMPGVDATGGMETALEAPNNQASPDGRFDTRGWLEAYRAKAGPVAARQAELALAPPQPKETILPEGAKLLRGDQVVAENAKAPQQSADYRDWLAEVGAGRTRLGYTEWATALKRAGASQVNVGDKPPAGYRWGADGSLVAIPGGPADKLPEKQQNTVVGAQNLRAAIAEYRATLADFSKWDTLSPDARAKMGTKYNNMMLQAKEAYNLGVLNGPDLGILTSVITDPRSFTGAITSKGAMDTQAAELDRIMQGVASVSSQTRPRGATEKPVNDRVVNFGDLK